MKFIKSTLLAVLFSIATLAHAGTININTADAKQLAKELVGVGKTRAEAIVQYREKNGQFKSIDELVKVDGIGHRTVEKNRENILLK